MKKTFFLFLFVFSLFHLSLVCTFAEEKNSDADVVLDSSIAVKGPEILDSVIETAGGMKNFDSVKKIKFTLVLINAGKTQFTGHYEWDKEKNAFKVTYKSEGDAFEVSFTIPDRERVLLGSDEKIHVTMPPVSATIDGIVLKNGKSVSEEEAAPILKQAYNRAITDSFWLLVPFYLKGPDFTTTYQGEQDFIGRNYSVFTVKTNHPGLSRTPSFELYVDPETRLIAHWIVKTADDHSLKFTWMDYQKRNDLSLSLRRHEIEGPLIVWYPVLTIE